MFPAASPDRSLTGRATGTIDLLATVVVAVYAAFQIALMLGHDPWVDEAQAWLLATAPVSNPVDLLILPGEGHPPLWHWLLRALSTVLDFSQARYINLPIAILNAVLLARLLRGEIILLFLMLGSFAVLQYWGYHFRPYALVFTCMLSALLLERNGRPIAGTWALAIACALHFFSGLFLALWLVWQWHGGTNLLRLLPPALFAAAFGLLAILSGLGNGAIGPSNPDVLASILHNLGWVGVTEPLRGPIVAILTVAGLTFALRRQRVMLAVLLALLALFSAATALIYGKYLWHAAFQTMLCFIAFMLIGITTERRWVLILLLVPQFVFGAASANYRLKNPSWEGDQLYELVARDAGRGFNPQTQLFAWPDLAGPAIAAQHDVSLISGNDGRLLGPIDWQTRAPEGVVDQMLTHQGRYWLICGLCRPLLGYLQDNGRTATLLGKRLNVDNGEFEAYRID